MMDSLIEQTEPSSERSSAELIEQKLVPFIESDLLGFKRTTFSLDGIKFSFRGREEMPNYQSLSTHKVILIGDRPKFLENEKFEGYSNWFEQSQNEGEAPKYLLATRTVNGVIELAKKLGGSSTEAEEILADLENWNYSPKVLGLLDKLIAAGYVDDQGNVSDKANPYGEALVVLSLIGDDEARRIVEQKVGTLRKLDEIRDRSVLENLRKLTSTTYRDVEGLNPSSLVAVHTTRYLPGTSQNGEYVVPSTFDATKGATYRNTVHTSLNHKVEQVNLGFSNWADTEYTLTAPFNSMIAANGLPTCFKTVDTWWAQNPGEPLVFRDATIVRPGDPSQAELIVESGKELKYKPGGFQAKDLAGLAALSSEPGELSRFIKEFNEHFFSLMRSEVEGMSDDEKNMAKNTLLKFIGQENEQGLDDNAQLLAHVIGEEDQRGQSIEERINQLLRQSGISDQSSTTEQNQLPGLLAAATEKFIRMKLSDFAIKQAIKAKGGEVKRGGSKTWAEGEWEVFSKEMKTAAELGIQWANLHSETGQGIADETFKRCFLSAFSDFDIVWDSWEIARRLGWEVDNLPPKDESKRQEFYERQRYLDDLSRRAAQVKGFKWFKFKAEDLDKLMKGLDQKTRRYIYATGVLNSRA